VILACLATEPKACESFRLPFARPMNLTQCLFEGSLQAMRWADENPQWTIRRWSCGLPEA